MKKLVICFFYILIVFTNNFANVPKWFLKLKDIKPLITLESDVNQIFNNPKVTEDFVFKGIRSVYYETDDGNITVNYSTGTCNYKRADNYDVKSGVLLNIIFFAKKEVSFSKFKLDLKGFNQKIDDDSTKNYYNDERGIEYVIQRKNLVHVVLYPSSNFDCLKCVNKTKSKK